MRKPVPRNLLLVNSVYVVAGLDVKSRERITELLSVLHNRQAPRVLLTLRAQDGVPSWITHILQLSSERKIGYIGPRAGWVSQAQEGEFNTQKSSNAAGDTSNWGKEIVKLDKVSITGRRPILIDVDWVVRSGERWALKGHNGPYDRLEHKAKSIQRFQVLENPLCSVY